RRRRAAGGARYSSRRLPGPRAAQAGGRVPLRAGLRLRHLLQPAAGAQQHAHQALRGLAAAAGAAAGLHGHAGGGVQPRGGRVAHVQGHGERAVGRAAVRLRLQPAAGHGHHGARRLLAAADDLGRGVAGRPYLAPHPLRQPLLRLHRGLGLQLPGGRGVSGEERRGHMAAGWAGVEREREEGVEEAKSAGESKRQGTGG
ncbi:hypothetical protein TSOC_002601, partial [Tetrabaena socialis]